MTSCNFVREDKHSNCNTVVEFQQVYGPNLHVPSGPLWYLLLLECKDVCFLKDNGQLLDCTCLVVPKNTIKIQHDLFPEFITVLLRLVVISMSFLWPFFCSS